MDINSVMPLPGSVPVQKITAQALDIKADISIARFDLIHPHISGNKIFKLRYYLEEALKTGKPVRTFGGPWSNHLAATATVCRQLHIPSTGIVRGDGHHFLSPTLKHCIAEGMRLEYLPNSVYDEVKYDDKTDEFLNIPEGGFGIRGAEGAGLMYDHLPKSKFIAGSAGSCTMAAGLLQRMSADQKLLIFPAVKNLDIAEQLRRLEIHSEAYEIFPDHTFGGFARYDRPLINFMNDLYNKTGIPTDIVYTAKLMFGLLAEIKNGRLPSDEQITVVHSGGLQGNLSLRPGDLVF